MVAENITCYGWWILIPQFQDFWTRLKNHLNDSILNETKKKSAIIAEMQRGMQVETDQSTGRRLPRRTIHGYSLSTFNTYINYLYQACYIVKPRHGYYRLTTRIPSDLNIEDVKLQAYGERTGEFIGIGRAKDYDKESMVMRVVKNRFRKILPDFITEEEMKI